MAKTNRQGIIQLVRTQNFPKNQHFLPPDTGKKNFPENFAYVLNEWFPTTKLLQWGAKRSKLKNISSIILATMHLFCSIKSKNYFSFLWKTKKASKKLKIHSMLPICHPRNPENPRRVILLIYYCILDVTKSFIHKLQRNHYGDNGVRSV